METSWPEKLWIHHYWKCSKSDWTGLWALKCNSSYGRGWTRQFLKIPFNPKHSVNLKSLKAELIETSCNHIFKLNAYFCTYVYLLGDSTGKNKFALYTSKPSTEHIQRTIYTLDTDIYEHWHKYMNKFKREFTCKSTSTSECEIQMHTFFKKIVFVAVPTEI